MSAPAPTIAGLAARLKHHADMSDAFGPCPEADDMRLAASVLVEMEKLINRGLAQLDKSVADLARAVHA